jgi:hypothetical protein
MSITAHSDIDGDGVLSTVAVWRPTRNAAGAATASPNVTGGDLTHCPGGNRPATVGDGDVHTCSADNIF